MSMHMIISICHDALRRVQDYAMETSSHHYHRLYDWAQWNSYLELSDYIPANSDLIEMLIPFTIMVTAIDNIIIRDETSRFSSAKFKYSIALLFGLIHGLAFASNFKFMMFDENILVPLFLFNIGIEVGQLFIVLLFMTTLWLYTTYLKGEHLKWNLFVSGAGFGIATTILIQAMGGGE